MQRSLKEALPQNKDKVNQELKKVIFEAYRNKTIESTDWDSFELESCVASPCAWGGQACSRSRGADELTSPSPLLPSRIQQQRLLNPTPVASTSAAPAPPTQTNGKRKKCVARALLEPAPVAGRVEAAG